LAQRDLEPTSPVIPSAPAIRNRVRRLIPDWLSLMIALLLRDRLLILWTSSPIRNFIQDQEHLVYVSSGRPDSATINSPRIIG